MSCESIVRSSGMKKNRPVLKVLRLVLTQSILDELYVFVNILYNRNRTALNTFSFTVNSIAVENERAKLLRTTCEALDLAATFDLNRASIQGSTV